MRSFKTLALFGRYNTRQSGEAFVTLGNYLKSRGCEVLLEEHTAISCGLTVFPTADLAAIGARADLAVVLGGDGSMLHAARNLATSGVPLVGVNQGRLGFMTDIAADRMLEMLGRILDGDYSREDRTLLSLNVRRDGATVFSTLALNDVVVNKGAVGRMIEFLVHINGEFVYDLRSDGLIVSTPTGSTAYALSSNGPILQPGVPGFALVPICPHTLSNRPITVSDDSVIEITLKRALDARLHYDGQLQGDLNEGTQVVISRAPHTIRFVHPPGYSYFAMLREKLHWSEAL
ncbi:MAG: NAD kinase [Betaproteobacteria bacterium]|nr:NAD kinase [Betaproteobacteria bacterium]